MRLLLLICLLFCFSQCQKESLLIPFENETLSLDFQLSEPYVIRKHSFQISIYTLQDANNLSKRKAIKDRCTIWVEKLPYELMIPFAKSEWDSLKQNKTKIYVSLDWDSDGNGMYCNGDLVLDNQLQFPLLELDKSRHTLYLKKQVTGDNCKRR